VSLIINSAADGELGCRVCCSYCEVRCCQRKKVDSVSVLEAAASDATIAGREALEI
jgi:hypothetical protein